MSELPEGWTIARLPDVCDLNPGKPDASKFAADTEVTFVPMAAVDADLGQITSPSVRPYSEVSKGFTSFQENDVIMAKITPCMENGKAAIARGLCNSLGFGSTEFHVFRHNDGILPEYIFYFIRQETFRKSAEANMTGSVGQKRVSVDFLKEVNLPLPPLNEQRRIVSKLEKLLGRVDAAQVRLATIPRILKRFRQSVLTMACSGKLTASWRGLHNVGVSQSQVTDRPEAWQVASLESVAKKIQDGNYGALYPKAHEWVAAGVAFIMPAAITSNGIIDTDKIRFISPERNAELKKAQLAEGDVIFPNRGSRDAQRNGLEPFAISVPKNLLPANLNPQLTLIRPRLEIITSDFLRIVLNSDFFLSQIREATGGSALAFINLTETKLLQISVPPLTEQQEIVRRVEALFKTADALEARYCTAKAHVDKLTQSILARAFRGELVTTEAEFARQEGRDYEPASVLLERIRQERAQQATSTKPKPKQSRAARKAAPSTKLFT
jgi:type I restriction enzyme S subunit